MSKKGDNDTKKSEVKPKPETWKEATNRVFKDELRIPEMKVDYP